MKPKSLIYVTTAVLMLSLFSFAGAKNSSDVNFDQPVRVAGTQLAAGQYKVVWEGTGPNVQVNFMQGRNTVASAPARIQNQSNRFDAIETASSTDNTRVLQAIDLRNISIRFDDSVNAVGN